MNLVANLQSNINSTRSKWLDIDSTSMYHKSSPDKWSRIEILGHLIDSARYNLQRFTESPLSTSPYEIVGYKQVELVTMMDYQHRDAKFVIDLWISLNQSIAAVWQSYDEETWRKPIIIKGQTFDLRFLAEDYNDHMAHHLGQIFDDLALVPTIHGVSFDDALVRFDLSNGQTGQTFVELLQYGDLSIEYYKPDKVDLQQPHTRDEIYIIISGHGQLIIENEAHHCKPHDILFVKAGAIHRFERFSDDFATWVVFYGLQNHENNEELGD